VWVLPSQPPPALLALGELMVCFLRQQLEQAPVWEVWLQRYSAGPDWTTGFPEFAWCK
jgi:hypothetical protein